MSRGSEAKGVGRGRSEGTLAALKAAREAGNGRTHGLTLLTARGGLLVRLGRGCWLAQVVGCPDKRTCRKSRGPCPRSRELLDDIRKDIEDLIPEGMAAPRVLVETAAVTGAYVQLTTAYLGVVGLFIKDGDGVRPHYLLDAVGRFTRLLADTLRALGCTPQAQLQHAGKRPAAALASLQKAREARARALKSGTARS